MARQALPLVDRLMAMVEGVNPLHVLYLVELSACPDPAALEAALRDLVLGEALLSSCLRDAFWGPQRWDWSPEEGGWPQLVQVADVGDEGALMRFRAWPLPLADGPPLRLLLRPERDGRCLLVLKLHHSASDATGAFGLLRRLAQSLSLAGPGQVAVTPKPPPGSPFWRLTWAARFRVLWAGSSELMKGFRQGGQGFATLFPLPAEGPSRHLALRLGPHEVEALRARAHVLGASLNELLMATLLHQLVQSLPSHQAELPWVTHMAVA